ncbi:MAG: DASS family sodium-coupled anion symporter [Candidatus Neomarinimicrobiota bacterium]
MIKYNFRVIQPLFLGIFLWAIRPTGDLDKDAYLMFIIFSSTILSILIKAIPMSTSVLIGLLASIITNLLSLKDALLGFGDSTTWLVVIAFLIAGVIIDTGLGKRIALICIKVLGKTVTGLGYAICASELILGPLVPSNTARGGGIIAPIVDSISRSLGSEPEKKPEIAGEYLHLVGAHANLITAAMFLTGMAANPIISRAALEVYGIEFDWSTWALGSIIPGLIGLAGLPIFLKYYSMPTIGSIENVREEINLRIKELGPWSFREMAMVVILLLMLILWTTKSFHTMGTTTVSLFGLVMVLTMNIATWDQLVKNYKAWDTLIWLGGLLTLATGLKSTGFISWISESMNANLEVVEPFTLLILLAIIYFYSMYIFSMLTAHIVALGSTIMVVASGTDLNPFLVVGIIAYISSLCGCLTNYSTGPVIIYFGNGYSKPVNWFKIGFFVSIYHLLTWTLFGSMWWKYIGWF